MMASVPTNPDLLTDLATLKSEVSQLEKTTDRLEGLIDSLSKDLVASFEGVKTQLNYAIGVAVFLIGMTAPVVVKAFSAPVVVPVGGTELRESERRMDRIEKSLERLTDEVFRPKKTP